MWKFETNTASNPVYAPGMIWAVISVDDPLSGTGTATTADAYDATSLLSYC